jgi:hypothetical protein
MLYATVVRICSQKGKVTEDESPQLVITGIALDLLALRKHDKKITKHYLLGMSQAMPDFANAEIMDMIVS